MNSKFGETQIKQEQQFVPDLYYVAEQDEKIQRLQEEFGRMADVMREMIRRQNFRRLDLLANEAEAMSGRVQIESHADDFAVESKFQVEEVHSVEGTSDSYSPSISPAAVNRKRRSASPLMYDDDVTSEAIRNFIVVQNLSVSVLMEATGISRSSLNRWIRNNEGSLSTASKVKLKTWFQEYRHGDGRTYTNRRFPEEINMLIQEELDQDRALNYGLLTALWQRCNSFSDVKMTRKQVRDKYNKMKKMSK